MFLRAIILLAILSAGANGKAPDFAALAKQADRYELPIPPKGAKLVLGNTGWTTCIGNSSTALDPAIYRPGFLLGKKPDNTVVVLTGFSKQLCDSGRKHRPAIRDFTATPPKALLGGYSFKGNSLDSFAVLVQCARRGDLKTAKALYTLYYKTEYKDGFFTQEPTAQYKGNEPLLLARVTYGYYYYRVLDDDADFKQCLRMLDKLKGEFPSLFSKNPKKYTAYLAQQFLEDLRLTVESEKPKPNSVEDLLSQMIDVKRTSEKSDTQHPCFKIYLMGTSAIPELVRLADSRKLTKKVNGGMMNARETRARLGQIARSILNTMVASHYPSRVNSWEKKDWSNWLKKADLTNEKKFFMSAAKPVDDKKFHASPEIPLLILATKYPGTLLPLAKKMSKSKNRSDFIDVIMGSNANNPTKIKALLTLYQGQRGMARRYMLQNLAKLDSIAAARELLPLIEQLPKDVNKSYWSCEEANLTHVVMQISDDSVWRTYLTKVKGSSVGLRMEMMNPMNYSYVGDTNKSRRLAFLAVFLDDKEVRTANHKSKLWEGPHAGFTIKKLSVQNFVAMKIGSLLDVLGEPSEFWKAKQWSEYRAKIEAALKKEKLPSY